jgi:hypothetical protein
MRSWTARVAITFVVWLLIAVGAWAFGNQPRPGLLFLMVAVAAALVLLHLDVSGDAEVTHWPAITDEAVRPPGADPRLERLQRVLDQHRTAHDVGDALHRHLAELADQRLVAHHGISLRADPERAAQLLGPELTEVVMQHPPYPRLSTARIDVLLQRIEAL